MWRTLTSLRTADAFNSFYNKPQAMVLFFSNSGMHIQPLIKLHPTCEQDITMSYDVSPIEYPLGLERLLSCFFILPVLLESNCNIFPLPIKIKFY